ncbi:NAD-dependent protein deacylase [Kordiimonas sp. SCSIO 12603]|uniref:Sir2 family NAD+-dependent deacetylase n=1 Tax=Kordiimonas sp. SCSIO 12603 TaxID=2829596 RepID=UPI0021063456|nr:Sir2 family NAD+-dependent deacetylase [Kordiimonas sp. SCSIO 12603]UTW58537.1 NAD-dependent protein deacylase [Kordiimonas sp. SCSIO 12603]
MGQYKNIVILTGAGISAESGVATFRDNDGLWEKHRIEDVATPEAFARDPDLVQHFYNLRRTQLNEVEPNAAHRALAKLQRELDGKVTIITQNVDDLHERGGGADIIHMHGELRKVRCKACSSVHDWWEDCTQETECPSCGRAPSLRPHIVWFGEMPFFMDRIAEYLAECDLFISIGTSGNVYPAAGFVAEVRAKGNAHTIEVNLEPSEGASMFAEHRHGKAGELLPALVEELLN